MTRKPITLAAAVALSVAALAGNDHAASGWQKPQPRWSMAPAGRLGVLAQSVARGAP
jgi:hypothetical protein